MNEYYFTFGLSDTQPFEGGWVKVMAGDRPSAEKTFEKAFPSNRKGILRCAFVYDRNSFEKTCMAEQGNHGKRCHAILFEDGGGETVCE